MAITINYAQNVGLMKKPPVIEIGDRSYTLIKLGDYEIMTTEVEDFGTRTPGDYNTQYIKYGGVCYYNNHYRAAIFAEQLAAGFVFVTNAILQNIFNSLTGTNTEKSLKMMGYYSESWPGTNETGLNLKPWGYKSTPNESIAPDYLGYRLYQLVQYSSNTPQYCYYSSNTLTFTTEGRAWDYNYVPVRFARHV